MDKNIIRFKVKSWIDRNNMVTALANSGYKVWVEENEKPIYGNDVFVCVELEAKENG